jgi:hypothetical protein
MKAAKEDRNPSRESGLCRLAVLTVFAVFAVL